MTPRALPMISFIVPVRNDARRLQACLTSIARNDYPRESVEILVMDNGSTDDSRRVAREAGARVLPKAHGSVAELRNAGAAAAQGSVLAFVDADHEIAPRWLRAAVSALSDDGVAAAGLPYSPPPGANWVQQRYDGLRSRPCFRADVQWLGGGNLAVKRAAFASLGGFDTSLETCEDVDFCQRLRAAGYRLVGEPCMRSVHMGDPSSLAAVFLGELWRGRDNLRVTLRGPRTLRHLRSAVVPLIDVAALALAVIGLVSSSPWLAGMAAAVVVSLAGFKAWSMTLRDPAPSILHAAQALTVAFTYDTGRALALMARAGHRSRRAAEG